MTKVGTALLLDRRDGVATIALNHPERANALDPSQFHTLAGTLTAVGAEPGLRAVVLTGQGDKAFCAGLNLRDIRAIREDIQSNGRTGLGAVILAAAALPVPLIGRINGACVAGGMGLLGLFDLVIASRHAKFGLPEIRHGLYPFVALAALEGRANRRFLTELAESGELISADRAATEGLVDVLCDGIDLDEVVSVHVKDIGADQRPPRMQQRIAAGPGAYETRVSAAELKIRQVDIVNS